MKNMAKILTVAALVFLAAGVLSAAPRVLDDGMESGAEILLLRDTSGGDSSDKAAEIGGVSTGFIPAPATLALVGFGLLGLLGTKKKST